MKALSTLLIVAATITHVSAAPTADPKNLVSESSLEAEYHTSCNHGFEKEREDKGTVVILAEAIV
ncbi:uncharacterized protein CLUP02_12662 [Colletotrichum lupini]|uniref:Uncharacterized protein n=1 Tax=Colletotrichum lupini TaxID=145971 RepID=A0A9Q8T2T1_9PEZI|nr:uncharacterized protein CLUP02_12662 [Colletotrichum lupini]UQC87161.1 hypothetical protein CLUP02_12662 [Colletotrichum lupini]